MRKAEWIAGGAGAGIVAIIYATPPVLYASLADDENWGEFFKAAAAAYGAATAGILAVVAASLALHNGRQDRKARQIVDDRRDSAETIRELRTRYTTAVEQLANPATTISQAGASALAGLADDWLRLDLPTSLRINTQAEAQTCINILCTYLRTNHPDYNPDYSTPDTDRRQPDQPVRDAILSTITAHLRPNPPGESWQHLTYDFTEASFHNANFDNCTFLGETTTFTRAKFHGTGTSFVATQFRGKMLIFERVEFYDGPADFPRAQFHSSSTYFNFAKFNNETAVFSHADFDNWITFAGTEFRSRWTIFDHANFTGPRLYFAGSQFYGDLASFGSVRFCSTETQFRGTKFHSGETTFAKAGFHSEDTDFRGAKFNDDGISTTTFENPTAWKNVKFLWDARLDRKPDSVLPDKWPPEVVETASDDDKSV